MIDLLFPELAGSQPYKDIYGAQEIINSLLLYGQISKDDTISDALEDLTEKGMIVENESRCYTFTNEYNWSLHKLMKPKHGLRKVRQYLYRKKKLHQKRRKV